MQSKGFFSIVVVLVGLIGFSSIITAQNTGLSKEFHKERRDALRKGMPENSVAVFFTNPIRNRSNDVDYVYHQDPNFYYLTGYTEPNAVLLIFKNPVIIEGKETYELIYVQEHNELAELWNGKRLGVDGVQNILGIDAVKGNTSFNKLPMNFSDFDTILVKQFENDVRNTNTEGDLYSLINIFKEKINAEIVVVENYSNEKFGNTKSHKINSETLTSLMASLREIKTEEELVLLKKAVQISAIAQIEVMKAIHPAMSETEVQGIHEFVYKKYGVTYEGYPSIIGAGNNGCVLHYTNNNLPLIGEGNLILMDVGAEYYGYTADVTRTIPANGTFTAEQKIIYDLVLKAQNAGIAEMKIGNTMQNPNYVTRKIINKGLAKLGIISSENEEHSYYPHGCTHHIGLDVHDASNFGVFKENMVLTVEPGIYIPEGSNCDKKWWGIAIRIEDDILITKKGPKNLSEAAPRTTEDIEETIKLSSALDSFNLPKIN